MVDRWPILLGSNLTVNYIASVFRLAQQGYRQQYVDVLDELLEKDAHAFAALAQRFLTVAEGTVEFPPALTPPGDKAAEERAVEIAQHVERRFAAIPYRTTKFYQLLWGGLYYGAGALETRRERREDGWHVTGLDFIHSRRLAYPDPASWDLRIWDQGQVQPFGYGTFPTEGFFGVRVEDYPGSFITYTPSIRGDYPTREGLGRQIAFLIAIKLMAMRGAGQYVERFAKPFALAYYSTAPVGSTTPRVADEADIAVANAALLALGTGSLSSAVLPDSIKVALEGPSLTNAGGIDHAKLIDICNSEISKAISGGTLQMDAGEKGARSLGEVHEKGALRNAKYDAITLADTLKAPPSGSDPGGLIWWMVHLDFPGEEHLTPGCVIHVEQQDPDALLERATKLAMVTPFVDARKLAKKIGVDLVDPNDPLALRMQALKPADFAAVFPPAKGAAPTPTPPPDTPPKQGPLAAPAVEAKDQRPVEPDAPADAPMGAWAWPARREGCAATEPENELEQRLHRSLRRHFDSDHVGLPEEDAAALSAMLRAGHYKRVLHRPPQDTLYRGIRLHGAGAVAALLGAQPVPLKDGTVRLTEDEDLATILGVDVAALEESGSANVRIYVAVENGCSTSWTAQKKITQDFAAQGKRGWAITLIADVGGENEHRFLAGPGGLYDVDGLCQFHLEKESVGLEPILVKRIEWERFKK